MANITGNLNFWKPLLVIFLNKCCLIYKLHTFSKMFAGDINKINVLCIKNKFLNAAYYSINYIPHSMYKHFERCPVLEYYCFSIGLVLISQEICHTMFGLWALCLAALPNSVAVLRTFSNTNDLIECMHDIQENVLYLGKLL